MTKAELIKLLEPFDDNMVVFVGVEDNDMFTPHYLHGKAKSVLEDADAWDPKQKYLLIKGLV